MDQYKLDLNSLLLAFESAVLEHFEYASAPFMGGEEQDEIDRRVVQVKNRMERIRHRILNFHEKWPNYDEDRLKLLNETKEKTSTPH